MAVEPPKLTPTLRKLLAEFETGVPRTRAELNAALGDPLMEHGTLRKHITMLRHVVRPQGREILCVWIWPCKLAWKMVRTLHPDTED